MDGQVAPQIRVSAGKEVASTDPQERHGVVPGATHSLGGLTNNGAKEPEVGGDVDRLFFSVHAEPMDVPHDVAGCWLQAPVLRVSASDSEHEDACDEQHGEEPRQHK